MADNSPAALMAEGQCYACYGLSLYEVYKTVLLKRAALAARPSADVTPAGLLAAAKCFDCSAYATPGEMFELALLSILNSTG